MSELFLKDIEFKQNKIINKKNDDVILRLNDVYGAF